MTTSKIICGGACCTDCLFLLANGETSPEWSEAETAEYLERVSDRNPPGTVTLGTTEHACRDESGALADDCDCDRLGFSWSACDVCGSSLGGDREAVTFWEGE